MSFAPGLLHVYFVGVGDSNSNYTQNSPLYLVTFVSRSEADNYWRRSIQLSHNRLTLRRFSPQLIMAPLPNIQEGWKCIIQTLKDNFNPRKALIAPPDFRPDNLNGQSVYIRSVTYPDSFWAYNVSDAGYANTIGDREKFTIKRAIPLSYELRPEEDILIAEDYVNIFVFNSNTVIKWYDSGDREVQLYRESYSGDTTSSPETANERFKFSFFTNGKPNDSERYWKRGDSWEFVI